MPNEELVKSDQSLYSNLETFLEKKEKDLL